MRNLHAADGGKDSARRTAELCGVALEQSIRSAPRGADFSMQTKSSAEPKSIQRSLDLSQNQNFRELSLMPGPMVEDSTAERM